MTKARREIDAALKAKIALEALREQAKAALFQRSQVFAMPVRRVGDSLEGFGIVYAEAIWRGGLGSRVEGPDPAGRSAASPHRARTVRRRRRVRRRSACRRR
ncbi:MAG: hypothetical protein ABR878_08440 [Roseiarcus sp.]|jgi:hypothetical protein